MKVNITGSGIIPGLGVIPPVYNHDMSDKGIMRLLNFNNFRVYNASTGALITRKNIKNIMSQSVTKNVEKTINQETTPEITKVEEPKVEVVEEVLPVDEETVEEVVEDTIITEVEDTVEEISDIVTVESNDDIIDTNERTDDEEEVSGDDYSAMDDKPENIPSVYTNNNKNGKKNKKRR